MAILTFSLALAAAVAAQQTPRADGGPTLTVGAEGRLSMPIDGDVVPSSLTLLPFFLIPVEIQGTSYKDLFPKGVGFRIEAALDWEKPAIGTAPDVRHGLFVRAGYDTYDGSDASDEFGNSFSPKSLEVVTAIVGYHGGVRSKEGLFADGRVGLGVVHYASVQAEWSIGGGPRSAGELLASTLGVASELGLKLGYRDERVEVSLGIDLEINSGPDRGRDVSRDVDPEPVLMVGFSLGVAVRF